MGSSESFPLVELSALTAGGRPRAPREMLPRLEFVAGLLQQAPAVDAAEHRLLWRNEEGLVQALTVDRVITIGRGSNCDLVLAATRVSRRHCEVTPEGEMAAIRDLKSTNGTRVNGVGLGAEVRVLRDGDVLEAGGVWVAYTKGAEAGEP